MAHSVGRLKLSSRASQQGASSQLR